MNFIVTDIYDCPFYTDGDCEEQTVCGARNQMSCVGLTEPQCPLFHGKVEVEKKKD